MSGRSRSRRSVASEPQDEVPSRPRRGGAGTSKPRYAEADDDDADMQEAEFDAPLNGEDDDLSTAMEQVL